MYRCGQITEICKNMYIGVNLVVSIPQETNRLPPGGNGSAKASASYIQQPTTTIESVSNTRYKHSAATSWKDSVLHSPFGSLVCLFVVLCVLSRHRSEREKRTRRVGNKIEWNRGEKEAPMFYRSRFGPSTPCSRLSTLSKHNERILGLTSSGPPSPPPLFSRLARGKDDVIPIPSVSPSTHRIRSSFKGINNGYLGSSQNAGRNETKNGSIF